MNGVPDICIDIFSSIARMLGTVQTNGGQNTTFSHNTGFQPVQPSPGSGETATLQSYVFFAIILFFLVFGIRRPAEENEKANNNNPNMPEGGGDDIY